MIVIEERKICRMLEGLFQFDKECEWNDAIEEAMHRFVNLPTIEAEPVRHGKWIEQESFHYELLFKCSVCGNSENMPTRMYKPIWEYCPNCGARMRTEEEDATFN